MMHMSPVCIVSLIIYAPWHSDMTHSKNSELYIRNVFLWGSIKISMKLFRLTKLLYTSHQQNTRICGICV